MAKQIQMPIKMEAETVRHDQFNLAESKTPTALTAEALRKSQQGEDVFHASDAADLLEQLGI